MKIIDSHAYIGNGYHLNQTEEDLLRQMDEADIALAIVCPVDHYMAVHNTAGNDLVIDAERKYPDRLAGMVSVNPWFGDNSVYETRRALSHGLVGIVLNPLYQGFRLNDPIVDPILEVVVEYDVPVYAHTGTAGIAEPLQLVELAKRFPSLNFIMGHAGASDFGEDAVRALELVENIWIETSRNSPDNYNFWKSKKCESRVIFGSSSPEYVPAIEIQTICDVFTDKNVQEMIFSGNIKDLYRGRLKI